MELNAPKRIENKICEILNQNDLFDPLCFFFQFDSLSFVSLF